MLEGKYVEYLVLGGVRHGEVWNGLEVEAILELPTKSKHMSKYYGRDTEAEITLPLNDAYFITKYKTLGGKKYMIASTEPLSSFNVEDEIKKISPPLNPVE